MARWFVIAPLVALLLALAPRDARGQLLGEPDIVDPVADLFEPADEANPLGGRLADALGEPFPTADDGGQVRFAQHETSPMPAAAPPQLLPSGPPWYEQAGSPTAPPMPSGGCPECEQFGRGPGLFGHKPGAHLRQRTGMALLPPHNPNLLTGWGMFNPKPERFLGVGGPMLQSSWMNRPWHVDVFLGMMSGGQLTSHVKQGTNLFGGLRLGRDLTPYCGWEMRYGFTELSLIYPQPFPADRISRFSIWDVSYLYYPWGDSRWRPFFGIGLGFVSIDFNDELNRRIDGTLVNLPISCGLKYLATDWLTLRSDIIENVTFGSDQIDTMSNFSVVFSFEIRFGGRHRHYWPWNPGSRVW